MKKILVVMTILVFSLAACADHHHLVEYSELPTQSQVFLQKYFNVSDISYIERERDGGHYEYSVHLKNTTEIDFDEQGNLRSIDCKILPIPEGIVSKVVDVFVKLHYPSQFIVEYSIGYRYLQVELSNGVDLIFDREGHFIRIDD